MSAKLEYGYCNKVDSRNDNSISVESKVNGQKVFDNKVKESIIAILLNDFPSGFILDSTIDFKKLKNKYYEIIGEAFSFSDMDTATLLESTGIRHGGKIFAFTPEDRAALNNFMAQLISENHKLFFYDILYDSHMEDFQKIHIISPQLLKTVLISIYKDFEYKGQYFAVEKNISIKSEVLHYYEMNLCLSYTQLQAMLPYVPFERIKQALRQNNELIKVFKDTYAHINKIELDEEMCCIICKNIGDIVSAQGYASTASIDVSASLELNPGFSETAIKNALYQKFLAERFKKRGNIISSKDTALKMTSVIKGYCHGRSSITLKELHAIENEIYGRSHSRTLLAACEILVRVDKHTFIWDKDICFNIDAVDKALCAFIAGNVIPIREVKSFTTFPYIDGYPWNLFLLESYCRRFSRLFKYQCLSVNSSNIGAIFRKAAGFSSYIEVLASAVASEQIHLSESAVGDFLINNGYIGQRTSAISDVILHTKQLIDRGV